MFLPLSACGTDENLKIIRIDIDPDEFPRMRVPASGLAGDAAVILRRLDQYLARRMPPVYFEWLAESGMHHLNISIESVKPELYERMRKSELDDRVESVGRKIRDAELRKIPYMLVVGDREQENQQVAVRNRKHGDQGAKPVPEFLAEVQKLIASKAVTE